MFDCCTAFHHSLRMRNLRIIYNILPRLLSFSMSSHSNNVLLIRQLIQLQNADHKYLNCCADCQSGCVELRFFVLLCYIGPTVYRRSGDRFLDDHLGDTGWTFRRQQLDVWAAMNICSGKGFSSSESTSKTLQSLQVGVGASTNLA